MKITDFRIGNLIHYFSEGENSVISVNTGTLQWMQDDNKQFNMVHSPIDLTEEWLVNFGFVIDDSQYGIAWNNGHEWHSIYLVPYENGIASVIKTHGVGTERNIMNLCEIKYVHQLQNLYFALTGEELKIK